MWPRAISFSIVILHHWLQNSTSGVDKPIVNLRMKIYFQLKEIILSIRNFIKNYAPAIVLGQSAELKSVFRLPLDRDAPNATQISSKSILNSLVSTWKSHDLNVSVAALGNNPLLMRFGSVSPKS